MDISVVVRAREDETGPEGILANAAIADGLGYPEPSTAPSPNLDRLWRPEDDR